MTDPHSSLGVARPAGPLWWAQGRASRGEYWIHIALLFALSLLLSRPAPIVDLVLLGVLLLVQARRLHDFGRSGWWSVGAFVVPLVLLLPLAMSGALDLAMLLSVPATLVPMVWIGAVRSDAADNRFGAPAPFSLQRVLTGR